MFVAGRILSQKSPSDLTFPKEDTKFSNILSGSRKPKSKNKTRKLFRWYVPFVWQAFVVVVAGMVLTACGLVLCLVGFYSDSHRSYKYVSSEDSIIDASLPSSEARAPASARKQHTGEGRFQSGHKSISNENNNKKLFKDVTIILFKNEERNEIIKSGNLENEIKMARSKRHKKEATRKIAMSSHSFTKRHPSSGNSAIYHSPATPQHVTRSRHSDQELSRSSVSSPAFSKSSILIQKLTKPSSSNNHTVTSQSLKRFTSTTTSQLTPSSSSFQRNQSRLLSHSQNTPTPKMIRSKLRYLSYIGPITMSVGSFMVVFACVVVCEARDQLLDVLEKEYSEQFFVTKKSFDSKEGVVEGWGTMSGCGKKNDCGNETYMENPGSNGQFNGDHGKFSSLTKFGDKYHVVHTHQRNNHIDNDINDSNHQCPFVYSGTDHITFIDDDGDDDEDGGDDDDDGGDNEDDGNDGGDGGDGDDGDGGGDGENRVAVAANDADDDDDGDDGDNQVTYRNYGDNNGDDYGDEKGDNFSAECCNDFNYKVATFNHAVEKANKKGGDDNDGGDDDDDYDGGGDDDDDDDANDGVKKTRKSISCLNEKRGAGLGGNNKGPYEKHCFKIKVEKMTKFEGERKKGDNSSFGLSGEHNRKNNAEIQRYNSTNINNLCNNNTNGVCNINNINNICNSNNINNICNHNIIYKGKVNNNTTINKECSNIFKASHTKNNSSKMFTYSKSDNVNSRNNHNKHNSNNIGVFEDHLQALNMNNYNKNNNNNNNNNSNKNKNHYNNKNSNRNKKHRHMFSSRKVVTCGRLHMVLQRLSLDDVRSTFILKKEPV